MLYEGSDILPQINVGRVISNPKFSKSFIVHRKTGSWQGGRWIQGEEISLTFIGTVTAGGTKDIEQVPEGDRTSQLMVFHSKQQMFVTHVEDENSVVQTGTSDEAEWKGQRYRILKVLEWSDFGYYKALGVSMGGD